MLPLTERQLTVLKVLEQAIRETGFAPVTSDIATRLSISSGAVVSAVTALELKGLVVRGTQGKSTYRTIKLADAAYVALGLPPRFDTKEALQRILNAWDAPYGPEWSTNLEASINAARPPE